MEIFQYLKNQRMSGNSKFFSIKEVEEHLNHIGASAQKTNMKLLKLYNHGFLEIRIKTMVKGKPWHGWNRKYRVKEQYTNGL